MRAIAADIIPELDDSDAPLSVEEHERYDRIMAELDRREAMMTGRAHGPGKRPKQRARQRKRGRR